MKEIDVAMKAAGESGKILMRYYKKKFITNMKPDNTPVTNIDRLSEKEIVSIIKKEFPDHNFLGEEFKYTDTCSEFKWIIDPLDGTKQFVRGTPFFGCMIGLERNGKIIAGVVNMPALKIFACASKGKGAFVNGKRAKVSKISNLRESFVTFGEIRKDYPYTKSLLNLLDCCMTQKGFGDILGYVLLAQGSVDVIVDQPFPWDIAAVKIIVEESGGKVTDFNGKDTIYSRNTISTNGKLHEDVLKIMNGGR